MTSAVNASVLFTAKTANKEVTFLRYIHILISQMVNTDLDADNVDNDEDVFEDIAVEPAPLLAPSSVLRRAAGWSHDRSIPYATPSPLVMKEARGWCKDNCWVKIQIICAECNAWICCSEIRAGLCWSRCHIAQTL